MNQELVQKYLDLNYQVDKILDSPIIYRCHDCPLTEYVNLFGIWFLCNFVVLMQHRENFVKNSPSLCTPDLEPIGLQTSASS